MTKTKTMDLSTLDPHLDYFRLVSSPKKAARSKEDRTSKTYNCTLKIPYKTEYGESLQVVGSVEELGAWKSYKCPMKWTEGHVWITDNLVIKGKSYFTYKYVVMYQGKAVKWERGPNRLADLEILPDQSKLQNKKNNNQTSSPDSRVSNS
mmetsp:Transcript_4461/g.6617  ORF Transcript_4461/g.6617 Transcript_4461/m.6617 type:complete len:150 (+) Transcript_4461:623-1072(+)